MSMTSLNINLDDLLLDLATTIEPSDADRRIIEKRYRDLKTHLERPSSPLAGHLRDDESRIYAQGSVSISATIISGEMDDRFDVDAMVEFDVPPVWSDRRPLDVLFEALQEFPGAKKIVRNTRCVTVDFAFMHMDVTIMDPETAPRPERVGEIFHSPDSGESHRVPSNPFGFSQWFRRTVFFQDGVGSFSEKVAKRRLENFVDRLQPPNPRAADQDSLPPMIPPRFDAQQAVALKLIKRNLNVSYRKRQEKKPPSIYITKMASDCGHDEGGLTAQLERLASFIMNQMAHALAVSSGPDERNPAYEADRINDRWPKTQEDRQALHTVMGELLTVLEKAKTSPFAEIAKLMGQAFGEDVSGRAVKRHVDRRDGANPAKTVKGAGTVIPATIITSPAIARETRPIPDHHFHCEDAGDDEENH